MEHYSTLDTTKPYSYPNDNISSPLPDSMQTATLIEQIGKDRSWTIDQIHQDTALLEKNRLYTVRDLRSLSNHSWSVMELLPLVRDLLKQAIDDEPKKKKKNKDKKKKKMMIMKNEETLDMSCEIMKDTLSDDPETIRNTIRNGSIDVGKQDPLLLTSSSPPSSINNKKSVSFSSQHGLIPPLLDPSAEQDSISTQPFTPIHASG